MRVISWIFVMCLPALGAEPNVKELLLRAHAVNEQEQALRARYTYFEDVESSQDSKQDKSGKPKRRTYECLFLEGEIYRKLVQEDGMPLTAKKQKAVEEEMAKEKSKRIENRRKLNKVRKTIVLGAIPRLIELHTLGEPQAERLDGREVWRVETQPRADIKVEDKNREILAKKTTFWLDVLTGAVVQREDRLVAPVNGFEAGSLFRFVFERVNGECWLSRRIELKGSIRLMKVKSIPFESMQKFRDYRKFDVESTMTPIAF